MTELGMILWWGEGKGKIEAGEGRYTYPFFCSTLLHEITCQKTHQVYFSEMTVFNESLADLSLSDSDNENGEFEICDDTGKEKHLLVNQPTFWLGTQSGL